MFTAIQIQEMVEIGRQTLALGEFSDEDINNIMTDINTVEEPEPEEWI